MTSKPVALFLADLGVTKTHSRPHVSNDNPYSEAQFKTLKYRPDFPEHFGSLEDARVHCTDFFRWYNTEHRHSSLGLHTPYDVHFALAEARCADRAKVLARRLCGDARTIRPPTARPRTPTHGRLDQSTPSSLFQRMLRSKLSLPGVSNSLTGSAAR